MSKYEKRKFNIIEHIPIVFRAALGFLTLKSLKRKKAMNFKLKERIMLAITEVNGCVLCSYVHTKLALKSGMTDEEIKELLEGDLFYVPKEESLAILFAKDYAFNHEKVDPIYYRKIKERYGIYKARAILSACEVITMTNSMGIAMGLLKETITFKHIKGSNILNEILIPIFTMILFPVFLILGLFILPFRLCRLRKKSKGVKKYKKNKDFA